MLKLRMPIMSSRFFGKAHILTSSDLSRFCVSAEEDKNKATNQNKIETEKFKKILPHLQERNKQCDKYEPSDTVTVFKDQYNRLKETGSNSNKKPEDFIEVTNVFDSLPQIETTATKVVEGKHNSQSFTKNNILKEITSLTTVNPSATTALLTTKDMCQLPMTCERSELDLACVDLPLPLHHGRYLPLLDSLNQDLATHYKQTKETTDYCYTASQLHAQIWIHKCAVELHQPLVDLQTWLSEVKPPRNPAGPAPSTTQSPTPTQTPGPTPSPTPTTTTPTTIPTTTQGPTPGPTPSLNTPPIPTPTPSTPPTTTPATHGPSPSKTTAILDKTLEIVIKLLEGIIAALKKKINEKKMAEEKKKK